MRRQMVKRLLILLWMLPAIVFSVVIFMICRARYAADSMKTIVQLGGVVDCRDETPSWLCVPMLDDKIRPLFQVVYYISFADRPIEDGDIALIYGYRNIEWLDLSRTHITDNGLKSLRRLPKLRFVALEGTRMSDVGLLDLTRHDAVECLLVGDNNITDDGVVSAVERMPKLSVICISGTKVTEAGVNKLRASRAELAIDW